jgi:hypothetical protein
MLWGGLLLTGATLTLRLRLTLIHFKSAIIEAMVYDCQTPCHGHSCNHSHVFLIRIKPINLFRHQSGSESWMPKQLFPSCPQREHHTHTPTLSTQVLHPRNQAGYSGIVLSPSWRAILWANLFRPAAQGRQSLRTWWFLWCCGPIWLLQCVCMCVRFYSRMFVN